MKLTSTALPTSDAFRANRAAHLALLETVRAAKLMEIGVGTSETRRMLIGREMMRAGE